MPSSSEYPSWTFSHEHNRSFAAFPITQSHAGNISVSFLLRTLKTSGLILQLKRGIQAYFSVFLRRGTINVAVNSSIKESSSFITDGKKVLITIDVQGGFVYFNHTEMLFRPGTFPELDVQVGDMVYLGGLPEEGDTIPWGGHFKGCLQDVRLDDMQLYMSLNKIIKIHEQPSYVADISHNLLEHCVSDEACKVRYYLFLRTGLKTSITSKELDKICSYYMLRFSNLKKNETLLKLLFISGLNQ